MTRKIICMSVCSLLLLSAAGLAMPKPDRETTADFVCKGGLKNRKCNNDGNWRFIDGSSHFSGMNEKGKTDSHLNMDGPEFIPWAQTQMSIESAFHGNYRERGVKSLSFDARTNGVSGAFCQPPAITQRTMSLEIRNDGGTPGDESDDCGVLTNLGMIPQVGEGIIHYSLDVPSALEELPETYQVSFLGGGCTGLTEDEAWNLIVEEVSQVRICWEQCDFLSIECIWDLDLDNITVVEPR